MKHTVAEFQILIGRGSNNQGHLMYHQKNTSFHLALWFAAIVRCLDLALVEYQESEWI